MYDSYVTLRKKQSSTLNHKPQLGPEHRHCHDEFRKNEISYAVGLMRSIAHCWIRLVNRKTAIVAKMTLHVGIKSKREVGDYVRYTFLVILLGCIILRLRVLRYISTEIREVWWCTFSHHTPAWFSVCHPVFVGWPPLPLQTNSISHPPQFWKKMGNILNVMTLSKHPTSLVCLLGRT